MVQRWPAVPMAAKATARTARSRSADGATMAALLPPSSRIARANRAASRGPTARPMAVEPVAETTAIRGSSTITSPVSRPPIRTSHSPSGASPNRRMARATIDCTASAVSGVFSDGFHTTGSPHTSASAAFHDHTATGKLNAEMTPHTPSGCQHLHHPVVAPFGRDGAAIKLARQPDREVADVDHLLDLAKPLRDDLAGFERDQAAEIGFGGAQFFAEQADELAAPRRRNRAPGANARAARPMAAVASCGSVILIWVTVSPVIGEATAHPVARMRSGCSQSRQDRGDRRAPAALGLSACIMATSRGYSHLDDQREVALRLGINPRRTGYPETSFNGMSSWRINPCCGSWPAPADPARRRSRRRW